jgi:quercetin dioxygenase-like cupin family protein
MMTTRLFSSADFLQSTDKVPIRSIITQSKEQVIVAWHVKPEQEIPAHVHPNGQDTWIILAGKGDYYLDVADTMQAISAGDVVVAHTGEVHGVVNNGNEPLIFISVVSPADAGYQLS